MSDFLKDFTNSLNIEKPNDYVAKLDIAEKELSQLRQTFDKKWTFCTGCRDYAKLSEAYEDVPLSNPYRAVLRCGRCSTIWKYLD